MLARAVGACWKEEERGEDRGGEERRKEEMGGKRIRGLERSEGGKGGDDRVGGLEGGWIRGWIRRWVRVARASLTLLFIQLN